MKAGGGGGRGDVDGMDGKGCGVRASWVDGDLEALAGLIVTSTRWAAGGAIGKVLGCEALVVYWGCMAVNELCEPYVIAKDLWRMREAVTSG